MSIELRKGFLLTKAYNEAKTIKALFPFYNFFARKNYEAGQKGFAIEVENEDANYVGEYSSGCNEGIPVANKGVLTIYEIPTNYQRYTDPIEHCDIAEYIGIDGVITSKTIEKVAGKKQLKHLKVIYGTLEKSMISLILYGKMEIDSKQIANGVFDYKRDASLSVDTPMKWSDTNAKIFDDITAAKDKLMDFNTSCDTIIFGKKAWSNFKANTEVKETLNINNGFSLFNGQKVSKFDNLSDTFNLVGNDNGINFYVTTSKLFDENSVAVMSQRSLGAGKGYGVIQQQPKAYPKNLPIYSFLLDGGKNVPGTATGQSSVQTESGLTALIANPNAVCVLNTNV